MTSACSSTLLLLSVTFLLLLFTITEVEAAIKPPRNETIPALFVFGDSTVDTGNNNNLITPTKCNFPPYGRDFIGSKPTGRFSNGKVPPDFIAEELGIKELLPAFLDPDLKIEDLTTGVNFASGGAGYDPVTSIRLLALSLPEQLELFKEYTVKLRDVVGTERLDAVVSNSLYLVSAGNNDVSDYLLANFVKWHTDVPVYTDFLVSLASDFVKDLHRIGARRIGVISMFPTGCFPIVRTLAGGTNRACADIFNDAAHLLNSKLLSELEYLNTILPQAKIVYMDVYNPLLDVMKNPDKYGFEIVDKGCCGIGNIETGFLCNKLDPFTCENASAYVYWDAAHPTEKAYKILTSQILRKYTNNFF